MTRVGIGYDSHRFVAGRPLILGGITIPHPQGLAVIAVVVLEAR